MKTNWANLLSPLHPGPAPAICGSSQTSVKRRLHLSGRLEKQVRQTSARNGLGVVAPALGWLNGLLQAIATQFSETSRTLCYMKFRLLHG